LRAFVVRVASTGAGGFAAVVGLLLAVGLGLGTGSLSLASAEVAGARSRAQAKARLADMGRMNAG
jgi:hypothetical protein